MEDIMSIFSNKTDIVEQVDLARNRKAVIDYYHDIQSNHSSLMDEAKKVLTQSIKLSLEEGPKEWNLYNISPDQVFSANLTYTAYGERVVVIFNFSGSVYGVESFQIPIDEFIK